MAELRRFPKCQPERGRPWPQSLPGMPAKDPGHSGPAESESSGLIRHATRALGNPDRRSYTRISPRMSLFQKHFKNKFHADGCPWPRPRFGGLGNRITSLHGWPGEQCHSSANTLPFGRNGPSCAQCQRPPCRRESRSPSLHKHSAG